ncbi:Glycerol-3-phosphate dehydrogenase [[Actinomadura] parvosata subsp. kistnae]|uniref:glycerol-3-phosphate dehydrogenase/oxidase n=1 Tax=[Actinomadura] parvosata TaxID=1955412 RepID=UPI0009AD8DBE|nr:glycerol-3-phosphate dehydrogenase/oxidase [Nonomuraea sp. ATCC 55076]SPL91390.1 Glycerol-3-phosphate dehydrogenase [Actinomadura parvosata subsp. kistnae]
MGLTGAIDARNRQETIDRLASQTFDVLVVGGGVTGAGAALDAAARGLRVALVESRDLAAGTSSRSSKLIHGGLRYLEQFDFKLVREALKERDLLVARLAPHLVRPVTFLYPLRRKVIEQPYVAAGLTLYDALEGVRRPMPRHRNLSIKEARRMAPGLRADVLTGAMIYYDAQVDDARFTLTLARTAAAHGAVIATRARAVAMLRDERGERVVGARVRDEESGREVDVAADAVVVCAGVWTDPVTALPGAAEAGFKVRMSKGVHVMVPGEAIDSRTGMIIRTEKSVLFIIPWTSRRWIVGTTDTDYDGDRAEPAATGEDIDYLLEHANSVLARPLTRDDVVGLYVGLRPLVAADETSSTTKLSREHVVDVPLPGLATIAGGKYTTYRIMAKDVIDAALEGYDVPESVTERLPLLGADGLPALERSVRRIAEDHDLDVDTVAYLVRRYGNLAMEVLDLVRDDPALGEPLIEPGPWLRAEVCYAVTHEGALHAEDIVARRTRMLIESSDLADQAAPVIAELMAGVLGWDRARVEEEIARCRSLVQAERTALAQARTSTTNG